MQTAATGSIATLRHEMRRVAYGPMMPRLWHRMRHEWQCAADRAAARAVRSMEHPGVAAEYRMAADHRR